MKTRIVQAKYRVKKGSGCKLCKPQKGGYEDRRTVRDLRLARGHAEQMKEAEK